MKLNQRTKQDRRERRRTRVRARVLGTAERPRLNVFRSLTGIFAQCIDDMSGKTLISANMKDAKGSDAGEREGKIKTAYLLGKALAEKAKAANITTVVFDRAGYKYHGRVKAVADGARDGGLQF